MPPMAMFVISLWSIIQFTNQCFATMSQIFLPPTEPCCLHFIQPKYNVFWHLLYKSRITWRIKTTKIVQILLIINYESSEHASTMMPWRVSQQASMLKQCLENNALTTTPQRQSLKYKTKIKDKASKIMPWHVCWYVSRTTPWPVCAQGALILMLLAYFSACLDDYNTLACSQLPQQALSFVSSM